MEIYAIKGDICYSKDIHKIVVSKDSCVKMDYVQEFIKYYQNVMKWFLVMTILES